MASLILRRSCLAGAPRRPGGSNRSATSAYSAVVISISDAIRGSLVAATTRPVARRARSRDTIHSQAVSSAALPARSQSRVFVPRTKPRGRGTASRSIAVSRNRQLAVDVPAPGTSDGRHSPDVHRCSDWVPERRRVEAPG